MKHKSIYLMLCLMLMLTQYVRSAPVTRSTPTISSPVLSAATLSSAGTVNIKGTGLSGVRDFFIIDDRKLKQRLDPLSLSDTTAELGALHLIDLIPGKKYWIQTSGSSIAYPLAFNASDPATDRLISVVNVKSAPYAAVGKWNNDRVWPDDTSALQAAFDAVAGAPVGSIPTVVIPSGAYFLSSSLKVPGRVQILSEGHAILYQSCSTCSVIEISSLADVRMSGLALSGGKDQLVIKSLLNETSLKNSSLFPAHGIRIDRCEFGGNSGFGIKTPALLKGTPSPLHATLLIERSRFISAARVLYSTFKTAILRDSWVSAGLPNTPANVALLYNAAGTMILDGLLGNPTHGTGNDRLAKSRWVDNYGRLFAFNTRFGGEDAGIATIWNYGSAMASVPNNVTIENSQISSGAQFADAGILYAQATGATLDKMPRMTWLYGNRGLNGGQTVGDIKEPFVLAAPSTPVPSTPLSFAFAIGDNEVLIGGPKYKLADIPAHLTAIIPSVVVPYLNPPNAKKPVVPITILPKDVKRPWNSTEFTSSLVDITDFGALPDDSIDDTAAILSAIKSIMPASIDHTPAGGLQIKSNLPIYFPPGNYILSDTLDFSYLFDTNHDGVLDVEKEVQPSVYRIIGKDNVTLTQTCDTCRIFDFQHGLHLSIENIDFVGGTNAIAQTNPNQAASELLVRNCNFSDGSDYAVLQVSSANNDGHLSTNLVVDRSRFVNNASVLRNVGDLGVLRDSDVTMSPADFNPDFPPILNHYGALTIKGTHFRISTTSAISGEWISNNAVINLIANNFSAEAQNADLIWHEEPPNGFSFDGYFYPDKIAVFSSNPPYFGGVINLEGNFFASRSATSGHAGAILVSRTAMPTLTRISECPRSAAPNALLWRNSGYTNTSGQYLGRLFSVETSCYDGRLNPASAMDVTLFDFAIRPDTRVTK